MIGYSNANGGLALLKLTKSYYKDHVKCYIWLQLDEGQEIILALHTQLKLKQQGGKKGLKRQAQRIERIIKVI
jgi:hypothetical protein